MKANFPAFRAGPEEAADVNKQPDEHMHCAGLQLTAMFHSLTHSYGMMTMMMMRTLLHLYPIITHSYCVNKSHALFFFFLNK